MYSTWFKVLYSTVSGMSLYRDFTIWNDRRIKKEEPCWVGCGNSRGRETVQYATCGTTIEETGKSAIRTLLVQAKIPYYINCPMALALSYFRNLVLVYFCHFHDVVHNLYAQVVNMYCGTYSPWKYVFFFRAAFFITSISYSLEWDVITIMS